MNRGHRAKFLLLSILMTASCDAVKVENSTIDHKAAPPAVNSAANENNSGQNAGNQTNANAGDKSDSPGKKPETADFEGTAGVTDKKYAIKGAALLREVRAAAHEGFDRVVFEFEGAEMPSFHIEYIDKPVRACGSGDVVPLAGAGWLEIRFNPAAAHTEDGKPTVKDREQKPDLKIIKEMKSTCDFEAEVEWVLGVSSPNKYRVLELKNPTRLALDIKH